MKSKKAQALSIVFFFVMVLSIFILGVLLMSMVNTILEPFRQQISLVSNESAVAVGTIQNKFNAVWDWTIVILFLFNVVILLFSSFMVDIHPAFLIIYIIALMFLFMFGSTILSSLDALYNPSGVFGSGNVTAGGNAYVNMPLTFWILNNFTYVILGIALLSGIIMYAKFKFGNPSGGNY
jgi:hypothetical protein